MRRLVEMKEHEGAVQAHLRVGISVPCHWHLTVPLVEGMVAGEMEVKDWY
jgi:hypothetical protein